MNEDICLDEYNAILQCLAGEFNEHIKDYFDRLCSDEPYLLIDKTKEEYIQEYKEQVTRKIGVNLWNKEKSGEQQPHKYLSDEADNGMVAIPRNLVDDIILELSICHGAYCTDKEDIVKKLDNDLWFKMDESQIINKIKKFI